MIISLFVNKSKGKVLFVGIYFKPRDAAEIT